MHENYIVVPSDSWKNEIQRYLNRLEELSYVRPEIKLFYQNYWLKNMWPGTWSGEYERAVIFIATFSNRLFSQASVFSHLTVRLWTEGHLFAVPLNTRFIFESWGAIHYAMNLLDNPNKEKIPQLAENIFMGAYKAMVELPTGGIATAQCPNVMEYIRALEDVEPDAQEIYSFLSSASHPNSLQNTYFEMMSSHFSAWGGKRFDEHAHALLEKVISAHKKSYCSLQVDLGIIIKKAATILGVDE